MVAPQRWRDRRPHAFIDRTQTVYLILSAVCVNWLTQWLMPAATLARYPMYAALLAQQTRAIWIALWTLSAAIMAAGILSRSRPTRRLCLWYTLGLFAWHADTMHRIAVPNPHVGLSIIFAFAAAWELWRDDSRLREAPDG